MPTRPIDFAQQLSRMRRDYGVGLRQELAELSAWAQDEASRRGNTDDWQQVRQRLHKLAGGASTFGFIGVGQSCRDCEHALDAILDGNAPAVYDAVIERMAALPDLLALTESESGGEVETTDDISPARQEEPLVYILEDEPETGEQLSQILESFEYRARLFDNGQALRTACRSQRPAALILDLHFAGGDDIGGLAVGEAIQAEMDKPLPMFASEQRRGPPAA